MMAKLLEILGVSKRYGQREVLHQVSLEVQRGEVMGLLGVNGAGKTTLSSIIAAVHPPTGGDVRYRGTSIYQDIIAYRTHIGYCPQKISEGVSLLSVYEQLWFAGQFFGLSGDLLEERIESVVSSFSLKDVVHRSLGELSGGYRQRFVLARSVIHQPDIVILDEPTVALDAHVRRQLWDYIRMMRAEGVAIVLTTHYLDEAEFLSDRICILHNGFVTFMGDPRVWMEQLGKTSLEKAFLHMLSSEQKGVV
jgi:ABC-2 type transport system ATP-binding protein